MKYEQRVGKVLDGTFRGSRLKGLNKTMKILTLSDSFTDRFPEIQG
jgi:hypothetical protein